MTDIVKFSIYGCIKRYSECSFECYLEFPQSELVGSNAWVVLEMFTLKGPYNAVSESVKIFFLAVWSTSSSYLQKIVIFIPNIFNKIQLYMSETVDIMSHLFYFSKKKTTFIPILLTYIDHMPINIFLILVCFKKQESMSKTCDSLHNQYYVCLFERRF